MDKRISMLEFKKHIQMYIDMNCDDFRVFRQCQNDVECELTHTDTPFQFLMSNSKFVVKLGPSLKYGQYVVPVYKLVKDSVNKTK